MVDLTQNCAGNCMNCTNNYAIKEYAYPTSVHTYALNFEILKFSAAPETNFTSILKFGGANSTFVG